MGLERLGKHDVRRPVRSDDVAGYLSSARRTLTQSLEKAKELSFHLEKSHERFRSMEARLLALESAMLPLKCRSLLVNALGEKIDQLSIPAENILEVFDVVRRLEKIINGDPAINLSEYLSAVLQLEEAVEYVSRNSAISVQWLGDAVGYLASTNAVDNYRVHRLKDRIAVTLEDMGPGSENRYGTGLLKTALRKLEIEFERLFELGSEPVTLPPSVIVGPDDPPFDEAKSLPPLLPTGVNQQILAIVEKLAFHISIGKSLEVYKDTRSNKVYQSLGTLDLTYIQHVTADKIDQLEWDVLEEMIALWTQHIDVAAKVLLKRERRLCTELFKMVSKELWIAPFGKVACSGFFPFLRFGEAVVKSKTSPEKLFKLLDMFEALENVMPSVLEVFEGVDSACGEARLRTWELQKQVVSKASQTFWEFGRIVEEGQVEIPPDGGCSRLCSYVVNYVKYLASEFYGPIMAKVLQIEASWKVRDRESTLILTDNKRLAYAVVNVMQALEKHAMKQSRKYADQALAHVYLMNNLWYMVTRAKGSKLGSLLGEPWFSERRQRVEEHSQGYQREAWGRVVSHLVRDGLVVSTRGKGAAHDLAIQRLNIFNASFEETYRKCCCWTIPETDLRDGTRLAVIQAVVPTYRSYLHTYRGLLEQGCSNTKSFMKYSPEAVEFMLGDLFKGDSPHSRLLFETNSKSMSSYNESGNATC